MATSPGRGTDHGRQVPHPQAAAESKRGRSRTSRARQRRSRRSKSLRRRRPARATVAAKVTARRTPASERKASEPGTARRAAGRAARRARRAAGGVRARSARSGRARGEVASEMLTEAPAVADAAPRAGPAAGGAAGGAAAGRASTVAKEVAKALTDRRCSAYRMLQASASAENPAGTGIRWRRTAGRSWTGSSGSPAATGPIANAGTASSSTPRKMIEKAGVDPSSDSDSGTLLLDCGDMIVSVHRCSRPFECNACLNTRAEPSRIG
mmetsp:Transcript_9498/g.25772  ORF Transcript_9498/g.25772 Transcript_9498/m.25772 type:complete len:268 (+) Transcript_9498:561-1364(+)